MVRIIERNNPTTICCKVMAPETAIQNINNDKNKINDRLFTTSLLSFLFKHKKRWQNLTDYVNA